MGNPLFIDDVDYHLQSKRLPERARRLGQEGKVVLRLRIDARGNLLRAEVVQDPGYGFGEAAVAAVKRSSFRPATIAGKPVSCIARLPIRFVLRN